MQNQYPKVKGLPFTNRIFFAVLISALVINTSGQPLPAKAAPARDPVRWYIDVVNPKTKICTGDTVEYQAKVFYVNISERTEWALSGVKVEAMSTEKSVGDFINDTAITGFGNEDLVTASFSFKAKKPGSIKLFFEGLVDKKHASSYVSFTVPVTVIPCKFKVKAISRWRLPGIHEFDITAMIDEVDMTMDSQGQYSSSANMNWAVATTVLSPLCISAKFTVSPSHVKLTGQMDDSGSLVVDMTYQPGAASVTQVCYVPTGTFTSSYQYQLNPDALSLSIASSGGVFYKPQVLEVIGGAVSLSGSSKFIVIPDEDNAVAFNVGSLEARSYSPSSWWRTGTDGFPKLISTPLDL